MAEIFSERGLVGTWMDIEVALAYAQAQAGVIRIEDADAISSISDVERIDLEQLWSDAENVGYPILPLVRQLDALLPDAHKGAIHFGATTQDIMDSGLALQLKAASARLDDLVVSVGNTLAIAIESHVETVMAARTHAQQAVPTTWGAKLAVYLSEFSRHRRRLAIAAEGVRHLSLFGAGGTSAAYGNRIDEIRSYAARSLGLRVESVPWHVSRDRLVDWASVATAMTGTCGRFAREIIDLSRTEIAEVREADGHLRGASSTMPQKANPISCEMVVGLAILSGALVSAIYGAMQAGHDRAAGEWQAEWQVVPQLACQSATALSIVANTLQNLQVFPDRMRNNLYLDHDLIMAEAYMMALAPHFGREGAHELVYAASRTARAEHTTLFDALHRALPTEADELLPSPLSPNSYLGDTMNVAKTAVSEWRSSVPENGSVAARECEA